MGLQKTIMFMIINRDELFRHLSGGDYIENTESSSILLAETSDNSFESFDEKVSSFIKYFFGYVSHCIMDYHNLSHKQTYEVPNSISFRFPISICVNDDGHKVMCFCKSEGDLSGISYFYLSETRTPFVTESELKSIADEFLIDELNGVLPIQIDFSSVICHKCGNAQDRGLRFSLFSKEMGELYPNISDEIKEHTRMSDVKATNIPFEYGICRYFNDNFNLSLKQEMPYLYPIGVRSPYKDTKAKSSVELNTPTSNMRDIIAYALSEENAGKLMDCDISEVAELCVTIAVCHDNPWGVSNLYDEMFPMERLIRNEHTCSKVSVLTELKFTKDVERCLS